MDDTAHIIRGTSASAGGPILAIILVSYLMIVLDISIVITALPRIRDDLSFSVSGLSWVQTAYTLTFGGLLLLGARAGDILGRRRLFIAGITLFTAASLAVGLAQSVAWLLAARAVQGAAVAIVAPATLSLLSTRCSAASWSTSGSPASRSCRCASSPTASAWVHTRGGSSSWAP